jgi:hypothetical protein
MRLEFGGHEATDSRKSFAILKLRYCPSSIAATFAALPSISAIPFPRLKLARFPAHSSLPSRLYLLSRKSLSSIETRSLPSSLVATLATLPSISEIPFLDSWVPDSNVSLKLRLSRTSDHTSTCLTCARGTFFAKFASYAVPANHRSKDFRVSDNLIATHHRACWLSAVRGNAHKTGSYGRSEF